MVQLLCGKAVGRGKLHQHLAVALYYGLSVDLVLPVILYFYRFCVLGLAVPHLLEGGALCRAYGSVHGLCQIAGAADIVHIVDALALCHTGAELLYLVLAHAVHEQVGTAVHQYRGAHSIVPVVVVCEAAERSLQTADGYGDVAEVFPQLLTVDNDRTVGALACNTACGICVIGALSLCGGVVCHH